MRAHGREALELARGEANPFPAVIAEPAEAELVMAVPTQERPRKAAEDQPTARVLRRKAAEPAVEDERRVVRAEAAAVGFGGNEELRRDVHVREANIRRRPLPCQVGFLTSVKWPPSGRNAARGSDHRSQRAPVA